MNPDHLRESPAWQMAYAMAYVAAVQQWARMYRLDLDLAHKRYGGQAARTAAEMADKAAPA